MLNKIKSLFAKKNNRLRGFEPVATAHQKYNQFVYCKPTRNDPGSAGYDFYTKTDFTLQPGESLLLFTDVKAYMQQDEVLYLFVRSSVGGNGIMLKNAVGVIDSTYYNNPKNDGNIGFNFYNYTDEPITYVAGERVGQGVFSKYLASDNDNVINKERSGGYGSSGK